MTQLQERQDQFLSHFERVECGEPGTGPEWLLPVRKAAIARFTELGFPTTKHEEWRYTNVAPIAETTFEPARGDGSEIDAGSLAPYSLGRGVGAELVFVNGRFAPELSSIGSLGEGVSACSLADAFESNAEIVRAHLARHIRYEDQAFVALNTALMEDGGFVYVPRGTAVETPIHLLFLTTSQATPTAAHPRNLIVVDENSQATVIETYVGFGEGAYFNNVVTELVAGAGAVVDHHKVQREGPDAYHIAATQVHLHRDTNVSSHNMSFGGGLVRNDVNAWLDGESGYATLTGLSLLDGSRHVDNHLYVDHAKPRCGSRETYKAILEDKAASVFSGRIIVREDAQKTDAKQTNQSLLLSPDAQVQSKPQLEILADDVKCTHGVTIGQVSEEAVFYLRSRGIPEATARSLLVYAFAGESVTEIKLEPLRARLEALVLDWLPQSELLEATA